MKLAEENDPRKRGESNDDLFTRNGNAHLEDHGSASDDDSGDENGGEHPGYELLPQNEVQSADMDRSESDEEDEPQTLEDIMRQVPPSPQVQDMIQESQRNQEREVVQERQSLFNQSSSNINVNKDHAETIRTAMAGFQLPQSSVPSWAANLSDEDLKKLMNDKLSSVFTKK